MSSGSTTQGEPRKQSKRAMAPEPRTKTRSRIKPIPRVCLDAMCDSSMGEEVHSEPYQMTGNFKEDFTFMCRQKGFDFIPDIAPRPTAPASPDKTVHKCKSNLPTPTISTTRHPTAKTRKALVTMAQPQGGSVGGGPGPGPGSGSGSKGGGVRGRQQSQNVDEPRMLRRGSALTSTKAGSKTSATGGEESSLASGIGAGKVGIGASFRVAVITKRHSSLSLQPESDTEEGGKTRRSGGGEKQGEKMGQGQGQGQGQQQGSRSRLGSRQEGLLRHGTSRLAFPSPHREGGGSPSVTPAHTPTPTNTPVPTPTLTPNPEVTLDSNQMSDRGQKMDSKTKSGGTADRENEGASGQTSDGAYTTFTTTTKSNEYFKPCIQVTQEMTEGGGLAITEIFIRGWKIDCAMMEVLLRCWILLPSLQTLQLWNTALDQDTMTLLANRLPDLPSLKDLVLDNNPLAGAPLSLLVKKSHMAHLSLRFCGLTDVEAYGIGCSLGSLEFTNCCLITLNLSSNCIGDAGAGYIADGLRVNRTLLVLNLASNRLGDQGAACLSTALSRFPISQGQMVARRQIFSRLHELMDMKENVRPKASPEKKEKKERGSPLPSPKTHREKEGGGGRTSHKDSKDRKESSTSKDRSKAKDSSSVKARNLSAVLSPPAKESSLDCSSSQGRVKDKDRGDQGRTQSPRSRKRSKIRKVSPTQLVEELELESSNALAANGQLRDGQLWITGNHCLVSLNLARNRIGRPGMEALLAALETQAESYISCRHTAPGLRRLLVHRNALPDHDGHVQAINDHMKSRDPLLKVPRVDISKTHITPCSLPLQP